MCYVTTVLGIMAPPLRMGRRGALINMKIWDLESWRGALLTQKILEIRGALINEICYFGLQKFHILVQNLKIFAPAARFPLIEITFFTFGFQKFLACGGLGEGPG